MLRSDCKDLQSECRTLHDLETCFLGFPTLRFINIRQEHECLVQLVMKDRMQTPHLSVNTHSAGLCMSVCNEHSEKQQYEWTDESGPWIL